MIMMKSTFSPLHFKFAIFENSSSTNIMLMEEFHDFAMMYLICIMMFLTMVITRILFTKFSNLNFMENVNMEIIWTVIPIGILIFLAYPSIYYLYLFDLSLNPMVTVKVFGFQWYWSYENFLSNVEDLKNLPMKSQTYEKSFNIYGNKLKNDSSKEMNQSSLPSTFKKVKFNLNKGEKSSYMIPDNELINSNMYMKGWRLLETDNRLIVPYGMEIQCLTTSMDVIHSFSIPDLGIKVDAIPGRLNSISFEILKPGLFYGQCSEICGTGHAFMPISMEAF